MRTAGLEWAYRLCCEPSRLARRYLCDIAGGSYYLGLQLVASVSQRGRNVRGQFHWKIEGGIEVFEIDGSLTRQTIVDLECAVSKAVMSGSHAALDMTDTRYVGADALGTLILLAQRARHFRRDLWIIGLRPAVQRMILATRLQSDFLFSPTLSDALRRIELRASIPVAKEAGDGDLIPRSEGMIPIPS
jgi:anti-anti-sigma factor